MHPRKHYGSRIIQGTISPSVGRRRSRQLMRARRHPDGPSRGALRRPLLQSSFVGAMLSVVCFLGLFPLHVTSATPTPALQAARLSLPGLASVGPVPSSAALAARPVPLTLVAPAISEDAVVRGNDTTAALRAQGQPNSGGDVVTAAREQQADKIPIFFEYKVQSGDTVSGIAARFGVRTDYVIWNNADVTNANALTPGQTLQVPSVEGIVHSVRVGDTVTDIALRYDAKAADIIQFRPNGLSGDPNKLREGSQILVPGGRKVNIAPAIAPRPAVVVAAAAAASTWGWPTRGLLTSVFGPSHPLGIDVAVPSGTPVFSAAAGTVTFVGGNPCCSYGFHIIVAHGAEYETMYAHLSGFLVTKGEKVAAGQRIALSGTSGLSTGPHLHFELHRNGAVQDPMQYLP